MLSTLLISFKTNTNTISMRAHWISFLISTTAPSSANMKMLDTKTRGYSPLKQILTQAVSEAVGFHFTLSLAYFVLSKCGK